MLVFTAYAAWQANVAAERAELEQARQAIEGEVAGAEGEVADEVEAVAVPSSPPVAPETTPIARAPETPAVPEQTLTFEGALFTATLSNRGAVLTSWRLETYEQWLPQGHVPVELVRAPDEALPLATPFAELGGGDLSDATFEIVSQRRDGVVFVHRRGDVAVFKEYTFDLDGYGFELRMRVENGSTVPISPVFEIHWPARTITDEADFKELSLVAYESDEGVSREMVASVGSPGFFSRFFNGGDDGPTHVEPPLSWAGVDVKYFATLLIPGAPEDASATFLPVEKGHSATAVLAFEPHSIAPGQSYTRVLTGFAGPKERERLAALGHDLSHSVNLGYSWLEPLTAFFVWLLPAVYQFIPNYGWVIILVTIAVRLLTAPIMARQMKSMERMRELQPRLKALQEKYKDDRQRQSEEMMKMYKETGVNPLGGCFPMILQFPVFIGLFFALQSAIELRQAPFGLWINDLSSPEVFFELPGVGLPVRVLPLVMGASMAIQQRMTPMTGMDPAQAKMMMTVMPVMMTVLFYQFPSGLVLYWMVSNFLGIGHQLWVRRNLQKT